MRTFWAVVCRSQAKCRWGADPRWPNPATFKYFSVKRLPARSVCLSVCLSARLSDCLCVCLCVCLSVCLSVSLFFFATVLCKIHSTIATKFDEMCHRRDHWAYILRLTSNLPPTTAPLKLRPYGAIWIRLLLTQVESNHQHAAILFHLGLTVQNAISHFCIMH